MFAVEPLYVQLSKSRLRVRSPKRSRSFDEAPLVGVRRTSTGDAITALGARAGSGDHVLRPFGHPRLFVHEFQAAEKLLEHAFTHVLGRSLLKPRIVAVVHPTDPPADGLTDIEIRVLRELVLTVGAKDCYFWKGRDLTDYELNQGLYRSGFRERWPD